MKLEYKLINGVMVFENVKYHHQANMVEESLKEKSMIEEVSIRTSDGRYFKLENHKLVQTEESIFVNPYYQKKEERVHFLKTDINKGQDIVDKLTNILKELKEFLEEGNNG